MTPVYDPLLGKLRNSEVDKSEIQTITEQVISERIDELKHVYVEEEEKMYVDGAKPKSNQ